MKDPGDLYGSWLIPATYLNSMLQCGPHANPWLEHALINCLPPEVFDAWKNRLVFLSTTRSDAFRVAKTLRETRELIVLSERIIPRGPLSEDHPDVRYFMFAALHEVVHAIKQHRPPTEITSAENEAQEDEANTWALGWYNEYVRQRNSPHLRELTMAEVEAAQAKSRAAMQQ